MMKADLYRTAGENIARQSTPAQVVSLVELARAQAEYSQCLVYGDGIGYVEKGKYWTQMFIGDNNDDANTSRIHASPIRPAPFANHLYVP